MKVYIVVLMDSYFNEIVGVYSTLEEAERVSRETDWWDYTSKMWATTIVERELDVDAFGDIDWFYHRFNRNKKRDKTKDES